MNYEIVEYAIADGTVFESVKLWINRETGEFKTFPVDVANPEYVSWAIAEGLMEAPVVVEPTPVEIIETAPVEL